VRARLRQGAALSQVGKRPSFSSFFLHGTVRAARQRFPAATPRAARRADADPLSRAALPPIR